MNGRAQVSGVVSLNNGGAGGRSSGRGESMWKATRLPLPRRALDDVLLS